LHANYFRVTKMPKFEVCLYRVDFEPAIDVEGMRKAFVRMHKETFGGHLYDGASMLYLTKRLPEDAMTFECRSREDKVYKMIVKNTGTKIEMTDGSAIQLFNLILRRTMEGLEMQLVGRDLYDPRNKVSNTLLGRVSYARILQFAEFGNL
jgi:aubergine